MERNSISKIRIKDIADLAGVSAGTVDRVLHNRGEVSRNTRERILGIIHDLDYQPDILASTLAARKTIRIAALIPGEKEDNPFWKYPLSGIEEGIMEIMHFGISLDKYFFDYSDRKSFIGVASGMLDENPQGVVMAPVFTEEASQVLKNCNDLGIPVVLINAGICSGTCLAFVGQDSLKSGIVAGRLMHYCTGSSSEILIVNFIRDKGNQAHIQGREQGFRDYFSTLPQPGVILNVLNLPDAEIRQSDKALEEAISSPSSQPKGIFVTNSRVFRVARLLSEKNINGIVLIGYDLLDENKVFLRNGTIDFLISQKPREQGYLSVIALYRHILLKKEVERDQYLPIDIIIKENLEHYIHT